MEKKKENEENALVTDFDFTMIADFFRRLDRQGPGGNRETLLALSMLPHLAASPKVIDIGCGTGQQTEQLATLPDSDIIAVDLLPEMIEGVKLRITQAGIKNVHPLQASMDALPFGDNEFDLLWCEGAIFIIGFERGLREWYRLIKQGGYIGITECCWITEDRPQDMEWITQNFTEIDTILHKQQQMIAAGYDIIGHFILPEHCWLENYYLPMEPQMKSFLADHHDSLAARHFVTRLQDEISYYKTNKQYYGYVFFIGRKR